MRRAEKVPKIKLRKKGTEEAKAINSPQAVFFSSDFQILPGNSSK